jgi:hypothetical protein
VRRGEMIDPDLERAIRKRIAAIPVVDTLNGA